MTNAVQSAAKAPPPLLVGQPWADLVRIAQVPDGSALQRITATAAGFFVVSEADIQALGQQLQVHERVLRQILVISSGDHWVGRFGRALLRRYASVY